MTDILQFYDFARQGAGRSVPHDPVRSLACGTARTCRRGEMSLTATTAGRRAATDFVARHGVFAIASIGLLHLTAIAIMAWTEIWPASKVAFLLTWGLSNFFWLALLRRPAIAAALSLVFLALLITLSEFKHQVLWMTLNFVDLMIIDPEFDRLSVHDFPEPLAHGRRHRRAGDPGALADLVVRPAAAAPALRACGLRRLLHRHRHASALSSSLSPSSPSTERITSPPSAVPAWPR